MGQGRTAVPLLLPVRSGFWARVLFGWMCFSIQGPWRTVAGHAGSESLSPGATAGQLYPGKCERLLALPCCAPGKGRGGVTP